MKVHFHLRYTTQHGENLHLQIGQKQVPMTYLNDQLWEAKLELSPDEAALPYHYFLKDETAQPPREKFDWDNDRQLQVPENQATSIQTFDVWNPPGAIENAFFTQPFRDILLKNQLAAPPDHAAPKTPKHQNTKTHIFRVKAPVLKSDEVLCLLGHGTALRSWDTAAPLLLARNADWWETRQDLSREDFPLAYKYGVWNTRTNQFQGFENGTNRTLYAPALPGGQVVLHDGFARFPLPKWRGAGVAIPVFSLRTEQSFGVGEFADLPALVDWAKHVGLKLIQLLPINDTSATGTWTDSYPYAAVSAFALHPIYVNLTATAGTKHAKLMQAFSKKQKALNALEAVDYEAVMAAKLDCLRQIFQAEKDAWQGEDGYQTWFSENQHWLEPYAAFTFLKEKHGTSYFSQWPEHQQFNPKKVAQLLASEAGAAFHFFVQWQLHKQLRAAVEYAHAQGIVLKGDIPIGIYRHSCDAWVAPDLYNMSQQAGAPPDDFAVAGQNWGFPTYNWTAMQADGYRWWRQRFDQMSLYFDAFRIDHILGFFRIWSIPLDAVEGILGRFSPALPVRGEEFLPLAGGNANLLERLTRPFITEAILREIFGEEADFIKKQFLDARVDGQFDLKKSVATQRQVAALDLSTFKKLTNLGANLGANPAAAEAIRSGLYQLISNVILFEVEGSGGREFHFRIGMDKTTSFRHLDQREQFFLKNLYNDYFYVRQDQFWQAEAMEKLPALKRATDMLICGEDLGMVPHCVPDVMQELGILSLEIQRMPKQSDRTFFDPADAPYLSVVTPSTHDMSTLRGWWEEDRKLTQLFYNQQLKQPGDAPYYCEPWVCQALLEQHLSSPAMWAIFQLQDLLGMDGQLRREDPAEERINVPANPKHYWRYRMHWTLEKLLEAENFNARLREMVARNGRG